MKEHEILDPSSNRRLSDQKRLESWKSIANYFNRSVRTVRRWEASENLPVHRHQHAKGFSVYAYPSELAEWQIMQNPIEQNRQYPPPVERKRQCVPPLTRYAAVAVVGVIVGVAGNQLFLQVGPNNYAARTDTEPKQLLEMMQQGDHKHSPKDIARTVVYPVIAAWNGGDPEVAFNASQRLQHEIQTLPIDVRQPVATYLTDIALAMGRIDEAHNLLAFIDDAGQRHELEATIMFASGRRDELVAHFAGGTGYEEPMSAFLLSVVGADLDNGAAQKETLLNRLTPAQRIVIDGIVAVREGRQDIAKSRFQDAVAMLIAEDQAYFFVGPDMLSKILKSEGDIPGAIDVLEQTMPRRRAAVLNRSGVFWLICQRNLANLYREAGRESDAIRVESELRKLLDLADDDFPLRLSLTVDLHRILE